MSASDQVQLFFIDGPLAQTVRVANKRDLYNTRVFEYRHILPFKYDLAPNKTLERNDIVQAKTYRYIPISLPPGYGAFNTRFAMVLENGA